MENDKSNARIDEQASAYFGLPVEDIEDETNENASDDIGPDDGSLARERFSHSDFRDRFESGQPLDESDY